MLGCPNNFATASWGSCRSGMPDYFEHNFEPYRSLIREGHYTLGIDSALGLLEEFRKSSPTYAIEHKGTPFYLMGYAAFASHDYATASLLFDAAVAEDIKKYGATADKPALHFIRLEDKDQEVWASQIIKNIIVTVEELLCGYKKRNGAMPITLGDLQTRFIKPILSSSDEHKRNLDHRIYLFYRRMEIPSSPH